DYPARRVLRLLEAEVHLPVGVAEDAAVAVLVRRLVKLLVLLLLRLLLVCLLLVRLLLLRLDVLLVLLFLALVGLVLEILVLLVVGLRVLVLLVVRLRVLLLLGLAVLVLPGPLVALGLLLEDLHGHVLEERDGVDGRADDGQHLAADPVVLLRQPDL